MYIRVILGLGEVIKGMGTNDFKVLEVASTILSLILKINHKFGVNHITSILVGSKSQKVIKHGHDKLENHGSLKNYSFEQVKVWIKELLEKGYLEQTQDEYPIIKLLDKSNLALAGRDSDLTLSEPDPSLVSQFSGQKGESAKKTWELFKEGKGVLEISKERGLAQATILSHLAYSFQEGEQIDINLFVSKEKQEKAMEAFQKQGLDFLTPVKQSLDSSFSWEDLKWVRAKLIREQVASN